MQYLSSMKVIIVDVTVGVTTVGVKECQKKEKTGDIRFLIILITMYIITLTTLLTLLLLYCRYSI